MEQMATKCPRSRAVIVGAGFGGLAAAKRLAEGPVDVTIIDQRNYHLFHAPLPGRDRRAFARGRRLTRF